jgi:drug/metabolite transporter (DMT)-like permease
MQAFSRLAPGAFVLLWATGFIGARYAMPWAEPFTFLSLRFIIAFLLLAGIIAFVRARGIGARGVLNAIVAGMLMHGVYLGGVFWAIHRGMPAGLSALIVGLQPLITALMARPLLGERIRARHWIGLAIGFAGVATVVAPGLGVASSGVNAATLSACLLAVFAMSLGTVWQKRFVAGTDLLTGTACQYLGGGALMIAGSFAFETRHVVFNGELVFALAWLVLVLSIGAIFLLMYMIREGEVSRVASLFYLVPAATAVIAWLLFDERLTPLQVGGMAVASFGVALSTARPGAWRFRSGLPGGAKG